MLSYLYANDFKHYLNIFDSFYICRKSTKIIRRVTGQSNGRIVFISWEGEEKCLNLASVCNVCLFFRKKKCKEGVRSKYIKRVIHLNIWLDSLGL